MIIREFKVMDGVKVFDSHITEDHDDYNSQGLDSLYKVEEKHFWFIARKEFIYQQMNKVLPKAINIIEVGAGTGNVSRYLKKNGYQNISIGEMHMSGLKYAKSYGMQSCYQFNLLQTPFENEFDTICMFDVIEHIKDDDLALQNASKSLTKNGYLVLTVPAHMWLWNRDDAIAGHKRRYTKKELINKLTSNGFEITNASYFFMSIVPLLYLRAILNRDDNSIVTNKEVNVNITINPIINSVLLFISRVENKLNSLLVNLFGGSLFIIARKVR
ncbi:class I SAM-dependent methyltransferase [Litorilituus lipolyticus]|uniref:Class I SAM-dependent methyltransferase n=1 Tax=Litorilituus lipolyticus TaxID=2491017 RepID=A0A502KZD2_9GAMM|nr:class I SAM-dependent methyltransferase [Litorilituus lipolyticus]TPH17050.1 class I SAM-dependent methyltransferase [Litorilituus lipolyticus]